MDEYGRNPTNPRYLDEALREREWAAHTDAQREWAKKRVGRSVAHVDDTTREDEVGDSMMQDYLAAEGLAPSRSRPKPFGPGLVTAS
jgi:hypothetical protein